MTPPNAPPSASRDGRGNDGSVDPSLTHHGVRSRPADRVKPRQRTNYYRAQSRPAQWSCSGGAAIVVMQAAEDGQGNDLARAGRRASELRIRIRNGPDGLRRPGPVVILDVTPCCVSRRRGQLGTKIRHAGNPWTFWSIVASVVDRLGSTRGAAHGAVARKDGGQLMVRRCMDEPIQRRQRTRPERS
jgi:hypothetical protein